MFAARGDVFGGEGTLDDIVEKEIAGFSSTSFQPLKEWSDELARALKIPAPSKEKGRAQEFRRGVSAAAAVKGIISGAKVEDKSSAPAELELFEGSKQTASARERGAYVPRAALALLESAEGPLDELARALKTGSTTTKTFLEMFNAPALLFLLDYYVKFIINYFKKATRAGYGPVEIVEPGRVYDALLACLAAVRFLTNTKLIRGLVASTVPARGEVAGLSHLRFPKLSDTPRQDLFAETRSVLPVFNTEEGAWGLFYFISPEFAYKLKARAGDSRPDMGSGKNVVAIFKNIVTGPASYSKTLASRAGVSIKRARRSAQARSIAAFEAIEAPVVFGDNNLPLGGLILRNIETQRRVFNKEFSRIVSEQDAAHKGLMLEQRYKKIARDTTYLRALSRACKKIVGTIRYGHAGFTDEGLIVWSASELDKLFDCSPASRRFLR